MVKHIMYGTLYRTFPKARGIVTFFPLLDKQNVYREGRKGFQPTRSLHVMSPYFLPCRAGAAMVECCA